MLKVLKYLKKTWISVIVIVALLCVQAAADLALPDYTSKIVNIGIQQGGIDTAIPEAISKDGMDNLLMFTNDDSKILDCYKLVSKDTVSNDEYNNYLKEYPALENEEVYVLNKLNKDQKYNLEEMLKKPLVQVYLMQNDQMQEKIKESLFVNVPEPQKEAMKDMELMDILKTMPEENLEKITSNINEQIDNMQGTIVDQAAISSVKEEYKKLNMDIDKIQNKYIVFAGLQMLGIAFISMASAITIMLFSARVAAKLGNTLRDKVFKKVLSFSTKEFNEFSTASLITRSTNDIQQIQMLITMLFRVVVYAPIIGIGGFIRVLTNSDTSMAWIIGLAILCIIGIVGTLFLLTMPKFKKLQDLVDKLNLVSREILTGLPVIRAFNTEKKEEKRFDGANKNLMKASIFVNRSMSMMMPLLMFIMNSITLLIVWVGGHNVDSGIMQVGDMMAFIQYTMQIVMSFLMISMISIMLPRAAVSAKRINEVIDTTPSIKDKDKTKDFDDDKKGLVEFKDVSFKYPDADSEILEDISFTAEPGKTTAIIGSTGSGKSTVVNLIPRFYDVTGGELLIDGVNIKDVSQRDLRSKIGFVPQKGMLFTGTIRSNIKYGNPSMSDEDMIKAATIAQATEFIESKPKKYDEEISQGGTNVSGGQRQRLSIARAIATDPEIFVFDDSFSALDFKTDAALREALAQKTKNKTSIIVAQRISTILNADKIIVLDDGKIVGQGTHEELYKTNETYKQIALSQLSEEELTKDFSDKDNKERGE